MRTLDIIKITRCECVSMTSSPLIFVINEMHFYCPSSVHAQSALFPTRVRYNGACILFSFSCEQIINIVLWRIALYEQSLCGLALPA